MKEVVEEALTRALRDLSIGDTLPPSTRIEVPRDRNHGDLSTNVAFLLAKSRGEKPENIAVKLVENLSEESAFREVHQIRGFINFRFSQEFLISELEKVLERGEDYYRLNLGKGKRYQLEFVSANPTGPLHLGHGRGAVVGDVLARVMSFMGADVSREYYINDAGKQVYLLGISVLFRYNQLLNREDLNADIKEIFEKDGYRGEYVKEIAKLLASIVGDALILGEVRRAYQLLREADLPYAHYIHQFDPDQGDSTELCSLFGLDLMMKEIREDLSDLGVSFDSWVSERELRHKGEVDRVIRELKEKGYTYEADGALWLKTSELGDDKDRVLQKSDGELTYFASDIAYHLDKFRRGFDKVIDLWGSDHHGYIKRVKSALKMLGIDEDWLEVYLIQTVKLFRGGREIRMSKRTGDFVTIRELLDEVGSDAVRFIFLTRRSDTPLDFNVDLVKEKNSDNPVFYVQYAHARIAGVFREFKKRYGEDAESVSGELYKLSLEEELELAKRVLLFKDLLIDLNNSRDPHQITFYLIDLAKAFHHYYNHNRIVGEDRDVMFARLSLLKAIRTALRLGLKLIGVNAPDRM